MRGYLVLRSFRAKDGSDTKHDGNPARGVKMLRGEFGQNYDGNLAGNKWSYSRALTAKFVGEAISTKYVNLHSSNEPSGNDFRSS